LSIVGFLEAGCAPTDLSTARANALLPVRIDHRKTLVHLIVAIVVPAVAEGFCGLVPFDGPVVGFHKALRTAALLDSPGTHPALHICRRRLQRLVRSTITVVVISVAGSFHGLVLGELYVVRLHNPRRTGADLKSPGTDAVLAVTQFEHDLFVDGAVAVIVQPVTRTLGGFVILHGRIVWLDETICAGTDLNRAHTDPHLILAQGRLQRLVGHSIAIIVLPVAGGFYIFVVLDLPIVGFHKAAITPTNPHRPDTHSVLQVCGRSLDRLIDGIVAIVIEAVARHFLDLVVLDLLVGRFHEAIRARTHLDGLDTHPHHEVGRRRIEGLVGLLVTIVIQSITRDLCVTLIGVRIGALPGAPDTRRHGALTDAGRSARKISRGIFGP